MRARNAIAIAAVLFATAAHADESPLRDYVRAQLDAQREVAARTETTVAGKLTARAAERTLRVRAAYRVLRDGAARVWADPAERMAVARRRAAARHVLAVDRAEVALLADEVVRVHAGLARLAADRAVAETLAMPAADLAWPARGDVARHFGTFVHDPSHATLSRHGIDLEVAAHAEAHAVADGTVRYAGPIRGLDAGVVVDHGAYWSVTAKLGELAVAAGAAVHRGDRLGDAARHRLYLELRLPVGTGGTPVDPELLLEPRDEPDDR